ncbi:hypothetical protein E4U41_006493 [Claviceps citrina]|nr:hypothetical protein E4U41_006493 [Claviceps citrina]
MPNAQESYSMVMPVSPPPPRSLTSYAQFMHDHTKRQMEASGSMPARSSTSSSSSSTSNNSANCTMARDYHR